MSDETVIPSKSLVKKLCEVMASIGWIAKSGENTFHHYKYATEADLVSSLRGELSKRNLFIFPDVQSHTRTPITRQTNAGQRETALTDIMVCWTFVDGDSGEKWHCNVPGCGEDSGDKGVYKALTGSEKYLLMKAFLIPTGDDPEAVSDALEKKSAADDKKHQDRASASVRTKVVQIYPHRLGDVDVVVFVASEALALLLENGLKDVTVWSDTLRSRYMVDDPEPLAILQKVCASLGLTLQRLTAAPGGPQIVQQSPAKTEEAPIIGKRITSAEMKQGKKGPYLSVMWGDVQVSCFNKELWEGILAAAPTHQIADFVTEINGKYVNLKDIKFIGERSYENGAPIRHPNDQGKIVWF